MQMIHWSVNLRWPPNRGYLVTCLFLDEKWSESPKIMFLSQFGHAFSIGNHVLYIFHVENGKINKTWKTHNFKNSIHSTNSIKTMVVKAFPQTVHFMNWYHMRTSEYTLMMRKNLSCHLMTLLKSFWPTNQGSTPKRITLLFRIVSTFAE